MSKIFTDLSCRVCLNVEELMVHIYEEVEDLNSDLSSLLELCGDLKVDKSDSYPKYLCKECTSELLIAAKFREKCNKTKEILSQIEEELCPISSNQPDIFDESTLLQINCMQNEVEENDGACQTFDSAENVVYEHEQNTDEALAEIIVYEEDDWSSIISKDTATDLNESVTNAEKQYNLKDLKYSCDICGAVFAYTQNLTRHLNNIHMPAQLYKCTICDYAFSLETNFLEHYNDHKVTNFDEVITGTETLNTKKRTSQIVDRKVCEYCNKEFKSQFALNMHVRTHTGERPFACEICSKAFKSNSSLKGHLKRHTGVKDFNCSVCNKSFFEQNNLKTHMLTHTGEKPHICAVCGKKFSRVFLLQLHMRTHTGEKPYSCPYCNRSFAQLCDAKNHIRTHTGDRQFQCPACIKNFTKRKALMLHMQSIHSTSELTEEDGECSNTAIFPCEEISYVDVIDEHL